MDLENNQVPLRLSCELHRRLSVRSTPSPTSSPRSMSPELSPTWSTTPLSFPPKTVILGLWPCATDEQIEYYVQGYAALYPSATLLLLRHSTLYDEQLGAALDALTIGESEKPSLQSNHNVLLHLFGDDGATQGCRLLRAYHVRTGRTLDVRSVVLDSSPKLILPSWQSASSSAADLLAFTYILFLLCCGWFVSMLTFSDIDGRRTQNRNDLNDPFLCPTEAKKSYIFAERDLMFSWTSCKTRNSDEECERQDYAVKRSSIDDVGRWTGDQERYWLGIENAWDGR